MRLQFGDLIRGRMLALLAGTLIGMGIAGAIWGIRAELRRHTLFAPQAGAANPTKYEENEPPYRNDVSSDRADGGSAGRGLVFQRAGRLRRGINLSGWYAPKPDYSSPKLYNHMSVAEMRTLKSLGFDHVRLCIDPEPLIADRQNADLWPGGMAALRKTVRDLTDAGLNVVLDIHPDESWKQPLAKGSVDVNSFLAFWTSFAKAFAVTDPEKVFFEVMNEPTMDDPYRWMGIQAKAVARIRSVAPKHTVIVTAAPYSNLDALLTMEPLRDTNVIYTFHEYDPKWFTHQGATWGTEGRGWAFVHGVPYPATPDNIKAALAQEPDEGERLLLQRYAWEHWDASRIGAEVAAVQQWAQSRGVPLYCGEFGVYREYADSQSRARWLNDVRTALESSHIGWAMWDYDGNFGLMTEGNEKVADRNVLGALGMSK